MVFRRKVETIDRITPGRIVGIVLLATVAAAVVVSSAAYSRVRSGQASPTPPAPPPSVGACLSQSREVVECADPHRWEVVAAWAADDPLRSSQPGSDTCATRAEGYGAIAHANTFGSWTIRTTVVTAVLDAPADRSAGPDRGWTACGVQPAWLDQRSGSIGAATTVAAAPDVFSMCIGLLSDTGGAGGADCRQPHSVQILGSWNDPAAQIALRDGALTVAQLPDTVQTTAGRACLALGAAMTGVADPTYGGRLDYRVVVQQNGSDLPRLNCLVTPDHGRVLIGSVTALGDHPVPLR